MSDDQAPFDHAGAQDRGRADDQGRAGDQVLPGDQMRTEDRGRADDHREHRGHYRLHVEGLALGHVHRDPAALEPLPGRGPEVRALAQSAEDRAAGVHRFETTVDGWRFVVAVEDESRALLREKAGQGSERGSGAGADIVRAPIPGRVVRLWVAEGDTVEAGQRLLAIEAMKMENEVRAPRPGTVASIRVAPDKSVERGDELLTVR